MAELHAPTLTRIKCACPVFDDIRGSFPARLAQQARPQTRTWHYDAVRPEVPCYQVTVVPSRP